MRFFLQTRYSACWQLNFTPNTLWDNRCPGSAVSFSTTFPMISGPFLRGGSSSFQLLSPSDSHPVKKIKSAAALHLPISFTLGCVLLLYTVLIASVLPYLEFRCGLTPEDYISPIPQPAVSPWIWIVSSVLYASFVIYFARKNQKRFKTDLPPFS